jgi:virulence-associated protein VagC
MNAETKAPLITVKVFRSGNNQAIQRRKEFRPSRDAIGIARRGDEITPMMGQKTSAVPSL